MANQTADVARVYEYNDDPIFNDLAVAAGTNGLLYEGMAVCLNGSSGATMVSGSNDVFVGFVAKKVDNTGGAALALNAKLRSQGLVQLTVVGAASQSNVGSAVYASDASTFTLTSTSACQIGKVHRWVTSTTCIVDFQGATVRSV